MKTNSLLTTVTGTFNNKETMKNYFLALHIYLLIYVHNLNFTDSLLKPTNQQDNFSFLN